MMKRSGSATTEFGFAVISGSAKTPCARQSPIKAKVALVR